MTAVEWCFNALWIGAGVLVSVCVFATVLWLAAVILRELWSALRG